MKNVEEIPLVVAYKRTDGLIVLIKKDEVDELIQKYGGIKNIPPQINVSGQQLIPEPLQNVNSKSCVYKIFKAIDIDNLSTFEEKMVRCSDFSIYR